MKQFLIAIDQVVNTLIYHTYEGRKIWGFADETLSARAWRLRDLGWMTQYKTINMIFFWQNDHCKNAHDSEMNRKHLPKVYR